MSRRTTSLALVVALLLPLVGACRGDPFDDTTRTRPPPKLDAGSVIKRVPTRDADQYHAAEVVVTVRRDDGSTFRASLNNPKLCMLGTRYPACDV